MSGSIQAVGALRQQMWQHGFRCLPVHNAVAGDKTTGKAPMGKEWPKAARKDPPECLNWEPVAWALNTGVLCDGLRAIDLDLDNPRWAIAVKLLAFTMFGSTMVRTRANSPRCLLVYRAAEGAPSKVFVTGASHTDDNACKVEVLGRGQQFVAYGDHWTGGELQWLKGGPADKDLADCPEVSETDIKRFITAVGSIIEAPTPEPPPVRKRKANGHDPAGPAQGDFFENVNAAALDDLTAWVLHLFPEALYQQGTGAWRVRSKDRGRPDLEEDISFHKDGIQDFGEEHGLTAIDAVIAFGGAPDALAAARWLCDKLGVEARTLGWREARMPTGNGHMPIDPPFDLPVPDPPVDLPDPPPPDGPDGPGHGRPIPPELPVITCEQGEIDRMRREAYAALLNSRETLYQRGGDLVQPVQTQFTATDGRETHAAVLAKLSQSALHLMMSRTAFYQKWDGRTRTYVRCHPPELLVTTLLNNRGEWPFPVVRGVLTCPTMRPDGSLLTEPGYDERSRYVMMFPQGLEMPIIAGDWRPTRDDALESLERLDALLDAYPFVNAPSRAVALAALMTPVLRCAMPTSPMVGVSAKAAGTGKSHLVDLAATIALGRYCPAIGVGKKDEEFEKGLNSMLMSGVAAFSIDNVSRDLDNPLLNIATERPVVTIRVFGTQETREVENAAVVFMTGNNLAVIDEQVRRTLLCDLDAQVERPERRHFTRDPMDVVLADRGRYILDVLTIARAYHVSGERARDADGQEVEPLGSYGRWSHFVREPLVWLGKADPVVTMESSRTSDPATIRLTSVVRGWYESFGFAPQTLADAVRDARPEFRDTMKQEFPARGGIEIDTTRMGHWLRRFNGRVVKIEDYRQRSLRFVRDQDKQHSAVRWKLEEL